MVLKAAVLRFIRKLILSFWFLIEQKKNKKRKNNLKRKNLKNNLKNKWGKEILEVLKVVILGMLEAVKRTARAAVKARRAVKMNKAARHLLERAAVHRILKQMKLVKEQVLKQMLEHRVQKARLLELLLRRVRLKLKGK